jgi:sugar phosphate isomerase/epimerase
MMGDRAQAREITIVIEPLNTQACNWINSVEDAGAIVRRIDHPNVKVLADLYHISVEKEGFHGVLAVGYDIVHVHVSSADRSPPKEDGADWTSMFRALKALGYDARLSMECRWTDFEKEAPGALEFLKRAWRESF